MKRGRLSGVLLGCMAAASAAFAGPTVAHGSSATVRATALGVYVHGMTEEIAVREIGPQGVGELLRLLRDPTFPRQDNVVAFLAYLGGPESSSALSRALPAHSERNGRPEDLRAALLMPHALGHIARRGDRSALDALLTLTADRAAHLRPGVGPEIREAAVLALAIAGTPAAIDRLAAIADGRIVPDAGHPELALRARGALATAAAGSVPAAAQSTSPSVDMPDSAAQSVAHALTFTNHANVTSPMTAARLDTVLEEASRRAATVDSSIDVACCAVVARSGNGAVFGSASDGLDRINDSGALNAVLGQQAGRAKVVNVINFCAGPGTNIIGCSFTPGTSMVVVRMSSFDSESVLWLHEYGHNLGLGHSTDPNAIMYPMDNGANDVLGSTACSALHTPAQGAQASMTVIGRCTDDGDSLADPFDNCPTIANDDQSDVDHDGIGDVCEAGLIAADIDLSGRVDGLDLARLGRAFGSSAGNLRYDAGADLDHDGHVDGDDLAFLASEFGTASSL